MNKKKESGFGYMLHEMKKQKFLMISAAALVIYGFIFYYVPIGGWIMAFQNYKPKTGFWHSKFVGLGKFQFLFSDQTFLKVIRNTLAMGILTLVATFVMAIVFAITSLFFIFLGTIYMVRGILNGIGDAMFAFINGVVEVITRIGFPIFLTAIAFIGVWGIWWSAGLVWMVSAITCLMRYWAWKRRK